MLRQKRQRSPWQFQKKKERLNLMPHHICRSLDSIELRKGPLQARSLMKSLQGIQLVKKRNQQVETFEECSTCEEEEAVGEPTDRSTD